MSWWACQCRHNTGLWTPVPDHDTHSHSEQSTHTVIQNSQHTQSFWTVNTHSHSEQSTHTVNLNSQTFTPSSLTQNAWGLFLAREVFGGIIPRLCFLSGQQLALTNATLEAGNSQRRLIELRRLWTHVPWRVACELNSLMDSRTMPGQHCQPTPTSLGQGCIRVYL